MSTIRPDTLFRRHLGKGNKWIYTPVGHEWRGVLVDGIWLVSNRGAYSTCIMEMREIQEIDVKAYAWLSGKIDSIYTAVTARLDDTPIRVVDIVRMVAEEYARLIEDETKT